MPHKRGQFSENKIRAASPSLYHLMMMKLKLLDIFPPPSYKSYLELTMMTQHCIAISPFRHCNQFYAPLQKCAIIYSFFIVKPEICTYMDLNIYSMFEIFKIWIFRNKGKG